MTSDKKVIEIHGVLQKPLEIGTAAFILEDNGIRRTSAVLEYKQVSENEIHFETLNTIYHLRLKQNKTLCGVILKHMIKTAEKPKTCRLYPFWVYPSENGFVYNYTTERSHHPNGSLVNVKDWIRIWFRVIIYKINLEVLLC